jgi:hypothetical protein
MPALPPDYVAARDRLIRHGGGCCDRCGLPLTLGQRGRHYVCREVEAVDQAEADHAAWQAAGAPEPPRLVDPDTGEVLGA